MSARSLAGISERTKVLVFLASFAKLMTGTKPNVSFQIDRNSETMFLSDISNAWYQPLESIIIIFSMACPTLLAFVFLVSIFHVSEAEIRDKTTIFFSKSGSTSWKNHNGSIPSVEFIDGTMVRLILLYGPGVFKAHSILGHGCGFVCCPSWSGLCQFAVVLVESESSDLKPMNTRTPPQIIWSANCDGLVEENATLEFIQGSYVLKNSNGVGV